MKYNISLAKLIGEPSTYGWTIIHDFQSEDSSLVKLRGRLVVLISMSADSGVAKIASDLKFSEERAALVHGVIERINNQYMENTDISVFSLIKEMVDGVASEYSSSGKMLTVAATSLVNDVVYSAVKGNAEVVIYRNGALAKILSGSKEKVVTASGHPEEGDVLILATRKFLTDFSNIELKTAIESKKVEDITGVLGSKLRLRKYSESLGAVFIKYTKKNVFSLIPNLKNIRKEKKDVPEKSELKLPVPNRSVIRRFTRLLPGKRIYIRGREESTEVKKSRKLAVSVGAILLVLLAVSIVFGIKQKTDKEKRSLYESRLIQAKHDLDEAVSLFSLNPERSRELFIESRNLVNELKSEEVVDPELDELAKRLEENSGNILGEYEMDLEPFVDLSLLTSGFEGKDLAVSEDVVYVLEKDGQKVASVVIDSKKAQVIAGPDDIDSADSIAAYSGRAFVVTKTGIFKIRDQSAESSSRGGRKVSLAIEKDWEGEILPYAYAGNFYVLEKGASSIWRYPGIEDTFGGRSNWFGQGVEPDLSGVVSWTIDGLIWLLSKEGEVSKYSLGSPEFFSISGVSPPMVSPLSLYTNEDLEYIYILDPGNSRVVVITKSGDYRAQYMSNEINSASDLAISEKEKKIIVLVKDKLYSIEIKHL